MIVEMSLQISPNLQVLMNLIRNGEFELAEQFEARYSPFPDQPAKTYKQELIDIGFLLNNPNSFSEAIISSKNLDGAKEITIFVQEIVPEYRAKFKNKKAGATGDLKGVIKKFNEFFAEYPEYMDKQLILSATDRYVNTCRKDNFKFLIHADYFIYKDKGDGAGKVSVLATFCEEMSDLSPDSNDDSGHFLTIST
jgi:hypothetical protein